MLAKHALSQLSYGPLISRFARDQGSFPHPPRAGADVRPLRLRAIRRGGRSALRRFAPDRPESMVGLGGLEPPTSRLSSARSNQLSYKPGRKLQSPTRRSARAPKALQPRGATRARAVLQNPVLEERETKAAHVPQNAAFDQGRLI